MRNLNIPLPYIENGYFPNITPPSVRIFINSNPSMVKKENAASYPPCTTTFFKARFIEIWPINNNNTSQNNCRERPFKVSAPMILPLYIRNGIFCMAAKGRSSTTVRTDAGKNGRGIVPPAKKSANTAMINRTPVGQVPRRFRSHEIYLEINVYWMGHS